MPEIPAPVSLRCDGCGRHFDSHDDLAETQVGTATNHFCRRCYASATGPGWGRTFEEQQDHMSPAGLSAPSSPPTKIGKAHA